MTLRAGLVMVSLTLAVSSGCSAQSATPAPPSGTLTRVSTAEARSLPSRPPRPVATDNKEASPTAEPERVADLVGFTSPSGNVGCYIGPTAARCDISDRDWTPPPRPSDCEFDYGQGINLSTGEAPNFVCAGDPALGGGTPLTYGQSVSAGSLRCDSAETGIICTDSTTGHGFSIAREKYQLF